MQARHRQCPECGAALGARDYRGAVCTAVKELVGAVYDREAMAVRMYHDPRPAGLDERISSPDLTSWAVALLHCKRAQLGMQGEAPLGAAEVVQHSSKAKNVDPGLYQSYIIGAFHILCLVGHVEWYGEVRYDVVQYGTVLYGTVGCGMLCYGVRGVAWRGGVARCCAV